MSDLKHKLRSAFTLIEVNLAIFVMAGGVLAMISLYSLGFRESRQSREDVAAAAFADEVLNPLVVALSSTNVTWKNWCKLFDGAGVKADLDVEHGDGKVYVLPSGMGWLGYITLRGAGMRKNYTVNNKIDGTANGVYQKLIEVDGEGGKPRSIWNLPDTPNLPADMTYALVASRDSKYSPVTTLAVRCVRKNLVNTLMAQPVFSTEVHFQGDPSK